jgi:predicted deacylase
VAKADRPRASRRAPATSAPAEPIASFDLGGHVLAPGERRIIEFPVAGLYSHANMALPVEVVNGRHAGPRLFVSAAIHGDELNGVEIIRRLLRLRLLRDLRGTLIAVPIVNVYGFVHQSRELPDGRDLNRSFPGSERGSLAARLAHVFMTEIVERCTHGIDLHTGSDHRSNLPQIRASLDSPDTERLASAFGAPIVLDARLRDGSLREAVRERGIPMLLYEGGQALRFDEVPIRVAVQGIVAVMRELEMIPRRKIATPANPITIARSSQWVRAPSSGIVRTRARLGATVDEGDLLGVVTDPFDEQSVDVRAPVKGVVIGRRELPLVNEGGALYHLAQLDDESGYLALESYEYGPPSSENV